MSNFAIYLIGTILVAAGLGYGAHVLGLAPSWITIIILVVIGFGIMGGIKKTRRRESSDAE